MRHLWKISHRDKSREHGARTPRTHQPAPTAVNAPPISFQLCPPCAPTWMILKQILDIVVNISVCLYKTRETKNKRKNQNHNTIIILKIICNFKLLFLFFSNHTIQTGQSKRTASSLSPRSLPVFETTWACRLRTSWSPRLRGCWAHGPHLGKGLGDCAKGAPLSQGLLCSMQVTGTPPPHMYQRQRMYLRGGK